MLQRLFACLLLLLVVSCLVAQAPVATTPAAPKAPSYFFTHYPATAQPDQLLLTWAGNPANSISVQWRTSTAIGTGAVAYLPRSLADRFTPAKPWVVKAERQYLFSPTCLNDPFCHRFTARLTHLKPDTEYLYAVGDGSAEGWGARHTFRTAPVRPTPFAFIYLGDAQYGFTRWAALQQAAARHRPDAAFFLLAGDQVTRGNDRDDWDDFLVHASEVFCRKPVMPAIGNHECKPDGFPLMYQDIFDLPRNGPADLAPERAYAFHYGNALFVVLDSNLKPETQTAWLEHQLAQTQAVWKFVMLHHPCYSSRADRDNREIREAWQPVFDRYHVDLVFQGHDHAYQRTYPLRGGQRVKDPAEGTIYLISVSGTKMYEQGQSDYAAVAFPQTAVYSVIDVLPADAKVGDRLVLRTYDLEGNLKDQLTIDKPVAASSD